MADASVLMSMSMSIRFAIDIAIIDEERWFISSYPILGPAWSIYSGKHSTLPNPLARMLSTQFGKAPVSKYRA